MTGLAQLVYQLDSFGGKRLRTVSTAATNEASLLAKRRIEAGYRAVGFSALKLRNMGGAPIRIKYVVVPKADGPLGIILAASGAAYLADKGAVPHLIVPRQFGRRALNTRAGKGDTRAATALEGLARGGKAQLAGALNTPEGPRAAVHHKGFRGKHPFQLAAGTLPAPVRAVYARHVAAAMVETFR